MVATSPPSATATPTSSTVPWVVVACSSTMECPAPRPPPAARSATPASVVSGPLAAVSCVADSRGWSEAGESSTMTQATTAMTAPTPTSTMTALR